MIYLVDSAIQLLNNRGQENPGSKYPCINPGKTWQRTSLSGATWRIRAYQADAQLQLKTSTLQENPEWPTHEPPNGQKCETHGSEFYTKIFWELKRRRRRRWWKRLLKKWVEAVEKFIAFIPCGSICLLSVSFPTVEFYRLYLSLKNNRKSKSWVRLLNKAWN